MVLLSERYINCTCSLDFIDKVPKESLFRVLRQRLPLLEGLYKLIIFNHEPFGTCAELVLSHEDLKQWKVVLDQILREFSLNECLSGKDHIYSCMAVPLENDLNNACNTRDKDRAGRDVHEQQQLGVHQPSGAHADGGPHHLWC